MTAQAFTTDQISWVFLSSAINRIQSNHRGRKAVDLNPETAPSIVLSCSGVEAFVNELSSLTHAFLFERSEGSGGNSDAGFLNDVATIRQDSRGSFYKRYKCLLSHLQIENPQFLENLSTLNKVRDALVHFRECDVPIIEDKNGVIREGQELPAVLKPLQNRRYREGALVANDQGASWTLRLATDGMAAWSLNLTLDAVIYVLANLPAGRYREFIWQAYAAREPQFDTVFAKGKNDVEIWWNNGTNQVDAL